MRVTRAFKLIPEYGDYHYEVRPDPPEPESAVEFAYCEDDASYRNISMTFSKGEALAIGKALIEFTETLK